VLRSRLPLQCSFVVVVAFLLLAFPVPGWTWGGTTHHYIAQNYSKHLPPALAGLRTYDSVVDLHVTDPDTRKGSIPSEQYRHYIDADYYPAFLAGTITHSRATLEAQYGASVVLNNGIVPWAVGQNVDSLTKQFQTQRWSAAALTIADMCHYVGDINQPLHCTQNYDGAMTGQSGIHSRYESTMMGQHIADLHTYPMPVTYYSSAVDAMFDNLYASWAGLRTILVADSTAKVASAGSYNTAYYASLWTNTQEMTRIRVDAATQMTASLVYTAWVNAGQPAVPGSTADVAPSLIAGARLDAGPTPFRDHLTISYSGAGPLNVDVYDVRGARVARLVDGATGAGSVSWGRNAAGSNVGPGLYFIRLTGTNVNMTRRVTLVQ
jgi:hypothetical protein